MEWLAAEGKQRRLEEGCEGAERERSQQGARSGWLGRVSRREGGG